MSSPLVSVVLLGFNRCAEMRECMQSIYAQDYRPLEVVVVDNGSTDGTPEMIETEFPNAKLVRLTRNIGSSAGRTRALKETSGKYVLQVDNDATLDPVDAIKRMVMRFEAEDDLGIIFSRVQDPASGRVYRPGYGEEFMDDEFYTWRFHGCAAMLRREAIDRAGYYLPEEFFRAGEENDLAVRVLDAGYNILHMPSVVALHKLSPKARHKPEIVFLNVRNNLRVAWKFYPAGRALLLTLWRVPHYLVTRLAIGDLSAFWRVFRIVAGQRDALSRRRPIKPETMALIDALTLRPAFDVEAMRLARETPPRTSFASLAARRLGRAAR